MMNQRNEQAGTIDGGRYGVSLALVAMLVVAGVGCDGESEEQRQARESQERRDQIDELLDQEWEATQAQRQKDRIEGMARRRAEVKAAEEARAVADAKAEAEAAAETQARQEAEAKAAADAAAFREAHAYFTRDMAERRWGAEELAASEERNGDPYAFPLINEEVERIDKRGSLAGGSAKGINSLDRQVERYFVTPSQLDGHLQRRGDAAHPELREWLAEGGDGTAVWITDYRRTGEVPDGFWQEMAAIPLRGTPDGRIGQLKVGYPGFGDRFPEAVELLND